MIEGNVLHPIVMSKKMNLNLRLKEIDARLAEIRNASNAETNVETLNNYETECDKLQEERKSIQAKLSIQSKTEVKDYYDKSCYPDDSYVQIFKYSKTDYSYLPYLKCPDYSNFEENSELKPTIKIDLTKKTKNNVKQLNSKTTIKDDNKILSYSINIYKNGTEVYTTGNVEANYEKQVIKNNDISKYTPGTVKVTVKATNIYGQSETKTIEETYKDDFLEILSTLVGKDANSSTETCSSSSGGSLNAICPFIPRPPKTASTSIPCWK